jgi:hypothetical protein
MADPPQVLLLSLGFPEEKIARSHGQALGVPYLEIEF